MPDFEKRFWTKEEKDEAERQKQIELGKRFLAFVDMHNAYVASQNGKEC